MKQNNEIHIKSIGDELHVRFTRNVEITTITIGHPQYKEGNQTIEIDVRGTSTFGEYADLYYCRPEQLNELLEYINSPYYIPSCDWDKLEEYVFKAHTIPKLLEECKNKTNYIIKDDALAILKDAWKKHSAKLVYHIEEK